MQITAKVIEQKESAKGPYTRIQDENNVWYSCFTGIEFKQGLAYEVVMEQKGQYKNIIEAKPLTMSQAGQPATTTGDTERLLSSGSKDLTIVREVCIKAAVDHAKALIEQGGVWSADQVVQVAQRYEKYVITGA